MATLVELGFDTGREVADALTDALLEHGALSAQLEDAAAGTDAEEAQFGEPGGLPLRVGWHRSRVTLLATDTQSGHDAIVGACASLSLEPPVQVSVRAVEQADWVRLTQSQFLPIPVGQRLLITPTWHAHEPIPDGRKRILLDPGLAFGTGSHPTTRLCLEWLDAHAMEGVRVIDYGCGSGILAIAAALLGAGPVTGVDIDPQALEATRANAHANGVLVEVLDARELSAEPAALVLANILASPLKVLAPLLTERVAPGGWLVLAGLLESQVAEVAACYPHVDLECWAQREGWVVLAGTRR